MHSSNHNHNHHIQNHDEKTKEEVESIIQTTAAKIQACNFLLVATGAGCSADSGLPTYADVARNPVYERQVIDYADLCQIMGAYGPNQKTEGDTINTANMTPSFLFYGFWGSCYNAYQDTTPHDGYSLLKKCNVDGHLRQVGVPKEQLHELHGSIDTWLAVTTRQDPYNNGHFSCITLDTSSFRFPLIKETLELNPSSIAAAFHEMMAADVQEQVAFFRPKVLMFDDGFSAHKAMGLQESSDRYQAWEEAMEMAMAGNKDSKLVVLEIGCGIRVPSVRQECQDAVVDTTMRCQLGQKDSSSSSTIQDDEIVSPSTRRTRCIHIRINPEDFEIDLPPETCGVETISIQGRALAILLAIDAHMSSTEDTTKR